jgi:hypothetical protein
MQASSKRVCSSGSIGTPTDSPILFMPFRTLCGCRSGPWKPAYYDGRREMTDAPPSRHAGFREALRPRSCRTTTAPHHTGRDQRSDDAATHENAERRKRRTHTFRGGRHCGPDAVCIRFWGGPMEGVQASYDRCHLCICISQLRPLAVRCHRPGVSRRRLVRRRGRMSMRGNA